MPLPEEARVAGHAEEAHVTVQVVTRHDAPWAKAGHVVAQHQALVHDRPAPRPRPVGRWHGDALGVGTFDARGDLVAWGGVPARGPRLELWRAPTENDRGAGQGRTSWRSPS
ncbi:beta-galactosidase domain 4-containing protein [Clavibacter tessellarius]